MFELGVDCEGQITLQNSVRDSKIPGILPNLAKILGILQTLPKIPRIPELDVVFACLLVLAVMRSIHNCICMPTDLSY